MFVIKILSKIINACITLIKILFLRFLKGSLKKNYLEQNFQRLIATSLLIIVITIFWKNH